MLQVLLWALGTGFITGAVWFGILFFRRQSTAQIEAKTEPAERLSLDDMSRRLLEMEERLDATEQRLLREKVQQPRKAPQ